MANEEQLAILRQGVDVWNVWRAMNREARIDLVVAPLNEANLVRANLESADLEGANLSAANLRGANFEDANLGSAQLMTANLIRADLRGANLNDTNLHGADLNGALLNRAKLSSTNLEVANLLGADLSNAHLFGVNLHGAYLHGSEWLGATVGRTVFADLDLRQTIGLEDIVHFLPSSISTDTFALSTGQIPEAFLRGCGLSDWEIELVKLYDPDLSNHERNTILYKAYDLQARQAIQISPLFISYSHSDSIFVDKIGKHLQDKGIRYWRDIHEMKAGKIETQIDRGIRQNPTVLLILSETSLNSDWVQHEVRTARDLEREMERDVLCPVALDDSWKDSQWPKRLMEQIMEYNILDFSTWQDDSQFDGMFRKLIDGLELFYKGEPHGK